MLRTQVRVRTNDAAHRLIDVVAGIKVAGYPFLIHPSITRAGKWSATYAPIGIGITDYDSIAEVIDKLNTYGDNLITSAIQERLAKMAETFEPLLAPETGIESEMSWRDREQSRLDSGEYRPMPQVSAYPYPKEHYVHLSVAKTESDFVAYTPSEAYGNADRQVRMKFGKYLRKTFSEMSDAEIQSAVIKLRAQVALEESPATLLFTTDRDKISEIFETEMYACDSSCCSCMHGKFDGREVRPYHVYADSPDVAVAYVVERGAIVARSVVSTKDKEWVRAYSIRENDSTLCAVLTDLLERQGYSEGDLIGNRLTKLPSRDGYPALPYIDCGGMGVTDTGKYWKVCDESDGEYIADQTDGTATSRAPQCSRCERDQDDCECVYCECCEEHFYEGCNRCNMCQQCERCIEHGACQCARCSDCNEIVSPTRRYITACECERCAECGELDSECDCSTCDACHRLTENCECEEDAEETQVIESTESAEVQA